MSDTNGHDQRPRFLAHHFDTPKQQFESGKTGMWLFLSTEILLFSGLFCVYAVYRANHPDIFIYAHQFLDKRLGGLNTVILILSSLTAAWAVRAAQLGNRRQLIALILVTLLCAACFLGVKGVEYEHKWKHGLLWGKKYHPMLTHAPGGEREARVGGGTATGTDAGREGAADAAFGRQATAEAAVSRLGSSGVGPSSSPADPMDVHSSIHPAADGPPGLARPAPSTVTAETAPFTLPGEPRPKNVQTFFGIYFVMTGLHGLHVIAGMIAWIWVLRRTVRGDFSSEYFTPVDLTALYWHLVDVIWIYLFPLLYLIH